MLVHRQGDPGDGAKGRAEGRGPTARRGSTSVLVVVLILGVVALGVGLYFAWSSGAFGGAPEAVVEADPVVEAAPDGIEPVEAGGPVPDVEDAAPAVSADQVEQLAEELSELRETVGSLPKAAPAETVEELRARLDAVAEGSGTLEEVKATVDTIAGTVSEQAGQIEAMAGRIVALESRLESLGTLASTPEAGAEPAPAGGPGGDAGAAVALERGIGQFRLEDYEAARESFLGLVDGNSEDARAWYYAALSTGKATGKWDGETERLVLRGVELERAGSPPKAEIDASFEGLTEQQGSAWLAFYRRRAGG